MHDALNAIKRQKKMYLKLLNRKTYVYCQHKSQDLKLETRKKISFREQFSVSDLILTFEGFGGSNVVNITNSKITVGSFFTAVDVSIFSML